MDAADHPRTPPSPRPSRSPRTGGSGAPVQPGGHHAQVFAHRLGQVAPELDPRLPLHALGQHGETVVRIHPAGAGAGQRLIGMHRQPRCVRQQVTDRGAGRACRGVEIHHPSSTATCAARATSGLVTDASANTRAVSPWVASTPAGPITAAAAAGTGQPPSTSRAVIDSGASLPGDVVVVQHVRLDLGHRHVGKTGVGEHRGGQLPAPHRPQPGPVKRQRHRHAVH